MGSVCSSDPPQILSAAPEPTGPKVRARPKVPPIITKIVGSSLRPAPCEPPHPLEPSQPLTGPSASAVAVSLDPVPDVTQLDGRDLRKRLNDFSFGSGAMTPGRNDYTVGDKERDILMLRRQFGPLFNDLSVAQAVIETPVTKKKTPKDDSKDSESRVVNLRPELRKW